MSLTTCQSDKSLFNIKGKANKMDKNIVFTPNDIVTVILAISAGIVTLSSAISAIANWINKARQPEYRQNERITTLEKRVDSHATILTKYEKFLQNDDERLRQIEESNRITQRGMLALLKHSINGEDVDSLRKAEKDLEEYLITKD